MSSANMPILVRPEWLEERKSCSDIRILDASWYLPAENRDAYSEYEKAHIPGAIFFDIDGISDENSTLPHMLPSAPEFAMRMSRLGLSNTSQVIIYDGHGLMSAARAWWMFRVFGHEKVAVLNGGIQAWKDAGLSLVGGLNDGNKPVSKGNFIANLNDTLVRSLDQVWYNLDTKTEQLVDARPAGRFDGIDPEPRAGLRAGHVPGSINVPFVQLLDPDNRQMLPVEDIREIFEQSGLDLERPIIASCGSGVTACVLALALATLGHERVAIYDGSWAEWGGIDACPIECR